MLLDGFGTLVSMEPPGPNLRTALAARGVEVTAERAAAGFAAEISYYLEHHVEGRDERSLADLRDRCARTLLDALDQPGLDLATARAAMLEAIRFHPFPDAVPALRSLRSRGIRLVVASNWDCSLPRVLEEAGLRALVDGVVSSAMAGAAKPDRALFEAALELADCPADRALYVGDSPENDVAGASAAGIRAILLRRGGGRSDGEVIAGLDELPRVI